MTRAALCLLLLACARTPAPSADYAEARRRHAALLAAHPSDAAARPEMDEVLSLLVRVPADSADAPAAAELRARIEAERKAAREETSRRADLESRAGATPAMPATSGASGGASSAASPAAGEGALRLAAGTKLADFRATAGECFEKKEELELVEGDKRRPGEAWGLKADPACAAKHPREAGQWVLFADGAYVSTRPSASAQRTDVVRREQKQETKVETFEAVPLPGGGWGRRRPDGKVEPLPPGTVVEPPKPAVAEPGKAAVAEPATPAVAK